MPISEVQKLLPVVIGHVVFARADVMADGREDRLVKAAFRRDHEQQVYAAIARDPMRPGSKEKLDNPRARSAKLRWARARDSA